MKRLMLLALTLCFVLAASTAFLGLSVFNLSGQIRYLSAELTATNNYLNRTTEKYSGLLDLFGANKNGELVPRIETRLGIRIMPGTRYPNYLWVTGQVQNTGNLTLYNAKLRFVLCTTNGTDTKDLILGTLPSNDTIDVRYSAFSSLGAITGWKIEPVATYKP